MQDTVIITLRFSDGSVGSINYFSNGNKMFPKERLEVFTAGKILQLNNFRKMKGFGWKKFSKMNLWKQDKGHKAEIDAFVNSISQDKSCPIPFEEIEEVTRASFVAAGIESRL